MKKLISLARGTPDYDTWKEVTSALDGVAPARLEAAVDAFEAASTHWPTRLDPWSGLNLSPGMELRRSPLHWVKEIYLGQHSPKHRAVRILESPRRPMRGQKLINLLDPDAQIGNLSQVGYNQARISTAFLKAWRGEGPWQQWKALRLWTCDLKKGPLKALARADLSALEQLNLQQNRMDPAAIAALVKAPGLSALKGIELGLNGLGDEGAEALGRADWLPQIERLGLERCGLSDGSMETLVGGAGAVRWLDLSGNGVGDQPGRWAGALQALETLKLKGTSIDDAGLSDLLAAAPGLRALDLDETRITDAGAAAVADSGQRWRALSLRQTQLSPAGLRAILTSPAAAGLERLELGAGFDLDNARLLIDGACPALSYLWWHGPEIGDGVEAALRADARLAATLPW